MSNKTKLTIITAVIILSVFLLFRSIYFKPTRSGVSDTVVKKENSVIKNLYRISDKIYRSAQPDKQGIKEIEKLEIKAVLNLRMYHFR